MTTMTTAFHGETHQPEAHLMSDQTHEPGHDRVRRQASSAEYWTYFAVIYIAAFPIALLKWTGLLRSNDTHGSRSPFREARAMTENVLPYIFMA